ncbi:MAG: hypothetical protein Q7T86_03055 [Hyphomicrobiaceae bacterium]|nr:hypothetical protein [Hyphomicrobiaceae bacterium]
MREVNWKPLSAAPKDGTAFLAYIPGMAADLMTRGITTMHWSGWGGGVWEYANRHRPLEHEVANAVWTELDVLAMSGKQASEPVGKTE